MVPTHQQSHQMAPLLSTSHYYDDPVSTRTSTANGYKCTTLHCILLSLLLGSVFAVAQNLDQNFDSQMYSNEEIHIGNVVAHGRAKREYNQTKRYDMKESDGATVGMVVIQLDKRSPQDHFKLKQPNKWITVDSSGAVRVKQPWDYEKLDKSKTIEFLVECNPASETGDQSHQRVVIQISDVNDEKPYFINRPLPMQTVVPLNAKPGESVFKLEARDPDTDNDIHYIMVRDRTGGRFEVDEGL